MRRHVTPFFKNVQEKRVKHDIIQAPTVTADILNFIDGEYRTGTTGRSFPNIDPAR